MSESITPSNASQFSLPGLIWVSIPGGEVTLVSEIEIDYGGLAGTKAVSQKTLPVSPCHISKYPVTNAQFQAFADAPDGYRHKQCWMWSLETLETRRLKPSSAAFRGEDHPRVRVDWWEAVAFCEWLCHKTGLTVTLPTEPHWQFAAAGSQQRAYAWGNQFNQHNCNTRESALGGTTPVTYYAENVSPFGVHDMTGNVWEWCADNFGAMHTGSHGKRGGSWQIEAAWAANTKTIPFNPIASDADLGFRLMWIDSPLDNRRNDPRSIQELITAISDPQQSSAALQLLAQRGERQVGGSLVDILRHADDSGVSASYKRQIIATLGQLGDPAAVDVLIPLISQARQDYASLALGWIGDPRAIASVIDAEQRWALPLFGTAVVEPLLARVHADPVAAVQKGYVYALGEVGDPRAADTLFHALMALPNDSNESAQRQFAFALAKIGDLRALERVVDSLLRSNNELFWGVLPNLGSAIVDPLLAALKNEQESASYRGVAASLLGRYGGPRVIEPLQEVTLNSPVAEGQRRGALNRLHAGL